MSRTVPQTERGGEMEAEEMRAALEELGKQLQASDPEWFASMIAAIGEWDKERGASVSAHSLSCRCEECEPDYA